MKTKQLLFVSVDCIGTSVLVQFGRRGPDGVGSVHSMWRHPRQCKRLASFLSTLVNVQRGEVNLRSTGWAFYPAEAVLGA